MKNIGLFIFDSSSSLTLYIQLSMKSYWPHLHNDSVILSLLLILITSLLVQVPHTVSLLPLWSL